jgi:methionine synthase I (cobalamin-dependent)
VRHIGEADGRCFLSRILVIDGAMGTSLQQFALTEADFRGE